MKRTLSPSVTSLLVAIGLVAIFAFSTSSPQAQAGPGSDDRKNGQKLEGSWTLMLTPTLPPGAPPLGPFTAYATFARGGAFLGSARDSGFSFSANPQHGVWEHRGGNRYALSFRQDLLDETGAFASVLVADALLTLDDNDSFTGVTNAELHAADGTLIMPLSCGTLAGERMTTGSLANPCSASTPPQ